MIALIASAILAGRSGTEVSGTVLLSSGKPAAQAAVFLEGSAHSSPLPRAVVDQRDHHFVPHMSIVTLGTKVSFPNNDAVFHNVFTEYHSARFDLGMYARGSTKTQVFDKPGVAVLLCSIHSDMSAYVMVVDTPYYALTDANGHFVIKNVPSGNYTVRSWHESGQSHSERASIQSDTEFVIHSSR